MLPSLVKAEESTSTKRTRVRRAWSRFIHSPQRDAVIYCLVVICLLAGTIAGSLAYRANVSDGNNVRVEGPEETAGAILSGRLTEIDIYKHQIVIAWYWGGRGSYSMDMDVDGGPGENFLNVDSALAYTNGINSASGSYRAFASYRLSLE